MELNLKSIFEAQKRYRKLTGAPSGYLSHHQKYSDVIEHLVLAADELGEAREEIPFRFGKILKSDMIGDANKIEFARELADTLIFMINSMIIMDIDADEFLNIVSAKQQRNIDRVANKERFVYDVIDPVIIIDGPDGVGKSSICKALSEYYQIPTVKISKQKNFSMNEENAQVFHTTIDQFKGPLILDRCFPSTMVYSVFFKRDYDISYLDNLFCGRTVLTFIIDCEKPFRDDELIPVHTFEQIRSLFLTLANEHKWKVIKNDTTINDCVQQIIDELQF